MLRAFAAVGWLVSGRVVPDYATRCVLPWVQALEQVDVGLQRHLLVGGGVVREARKGRVQEFPRGIS